MNVRNRPGPIVVAAFRAVCDHGQHDVEVITDGTRVASSYHDTAGRAGVTREGSMFRLPCPALLRTDEFCDGKVTVNQGDPPAWRAATPEDASWLDTDTQQVDHA